MALLPDSGTFDEQLSGPGLKKMNLPGSRLAAIKGYNS